MDLLFIKRNNTILLFILIFILGVFLRTYHLDRVPNGLYQDETAIGYNAYSILQTGKDEYGNDFPLYFKSFGDYKLPVYIYLTVIPVKLFGLSDIAPRVISCFFSILTLGIFFFLAKRLTGNLPISLIGMFLLAINPWHLHYGRATFEVSVGLFFFCFGMYFLLSKKISYISLIVGIMCFVIALYTYNLTRLLSPVLLLLMIFYRYKDIQKMSLWKKSAGVAVGVLGLLPLLLTMMNPEGVASAGGTLITSSASIQASLLEMRSYMIDFPSVFQKIFFSSITQTLWEYVRHIFSYISVDFFFIHGSNHGNHGIGNTGQFYLFEMVTIIIGIVMIFVRKELWRWYVAGWAILVICVAALTREAPHATRSFFLLVPYVLFSAYGCLWIFEKIKKMKKGFAIGLSMLLSIFVIYNIVYYFSSYYERFPIYYAQKWNSEDEELSEYISKNESKYQKIIIDTESGLIYTSLLYYLAYSPADFQRTVTREPDDSEGFSKVKSFGKFEFRKINWESDSKMKNTLFITKNENVGGQKIVNKILYPQRPVVINVGQEIHQFPVSDVAYVLSKTN